MRFKYNPSLIWEKCFGFAHCTFYVWWFSKTQFECWDKNLSIFTWTDQSSSFIWHEQSPIHLLVYYIGKQISSSPAKEVLYKRSHSVCQPLFRHLNIIFNSRVQSFFNNYKSWNICHFSIQQSLKSLVLSWNKETQDLIFISVFGKTWLQCFLQIRKLDIPSANLC